MREEGYIGIGVEAGGEEGKRRGEEGRKERELREGAYIGEREVGKNVFVSSCRIIWESFHPSRKEISHLSLGCQLTSIALASAPSAVVLSHSLRWS